MLQIGPGEHGSTFGGNPLACAVAVTAIQVLVEEGMIENSQARGEQFRQGLKAILSPSILEVRGKGLLNAIEMKEEHPYSATDICYRFKKLGLLAKPTHGHIIRLAPPLVITENEIDMALERISQAFHEADKSIA
jgi:ornithine--oxo-acid transaminase